MPTICMNAIILFSLMSTCVPLPIFLISPENAIQDTVLTHPAVLINSAMEDSLSNELRNNFYKNPNIAASLAKESWFIDKEMQVIDRETDKISREKIYSLLHNAGLTRK
ncbi:uncharacterized protein LOC114944689 [Nylanderia fulva]|uniref:uncharacterized protein LOC114944689 n=1 Tax=Nylanderia fulva TaxID=613905 RepID=UPI0010FAF40D|nr:uncharacterized protein LOC114944689 [Nylanderia fulva]